MRDIQVSYVMRAWRRYGATLLASVFALSWSHSALSSGSGGKDEQEQRQDQHQDQSQEQEANAEAQAEAHASSEASSNEQQTSINTSYQRPGSAYLGSGDSTAPDTKVRAISGGWLTGSAGIRWDMTDKEARKWRWAEELETDGFVHAATELRCSIKTVYAALGGKEACSTMLAVIDAQDATERQDTELDILRRELNMLREQVEMSEERCDRQWESCVRK